MDTMLLQRSPQALLKEQYRLMLQRLLAERFHLAAHRESRDLPRYVLVSGKGKPKLKSSAEPPPPGPSVVASIVGGHMRFSDHNKPLGALTDFLQVVLSGPVTDETGISGDYDVTIEFMPDDRFRGFASLPPVKDADSVPNLFIAIQDQLGLKLETRKGPVGVLVVDRADKEPVVN
jgi:uncharacterized protein (TIGR03435 family)